MPQEEINILVSGHLKNLVMMTEKEKEYIQSVIKADFQEAGDEDVFRKIKADLKDHNVSDEDIRNKMKEL